MSDRKSLIDNYYHQYDEDERLLKDNAHNVEFIVTKHYINKYLKKSDRILEIGAGTGRYSLFYANKGYDVTAIEYIQHNLEILKSKITPNMKISAEQGDAVDLSRFKDNIFDVTLVLGPLYHLYKDTDIQSAISEAIRVTKKNGIIMLAYITSDAVFARWSIENHHLLDGNSKNFDENFKLKRCPEGIFAPFYVDEFKQVMKGFNVEYLHNVATDGIANIMSDKINNLTEKAFKTWVDYQLSVCERIDCQGYSCHMLYICKKVL